ncbi:PhoH family protein [Helcobacillus massiliensis]|uniref:PhoH family protein n=1 Tax=Helcobacillus TaxID=1161125 RepID=UPI001EF573AC|nr:MULTISPECIES: PhoH family protein [Helcobacillus]MCG7426580.1 PhoH family protein [Helcobacillus sp. ACRRO]MCT1557162.1 PhoH family protein [Helcobacillus massiliensis]MCT2036103.1 PhoH family protein [Helcobacillus massiliensis]MCT2331234.1 PhoH family protein [Helcobacillus massiliensis]
MSSADTDPDIRSWDIAIPDHLNPVAVLGANDQALNVIEKILPDVDVSMRGHRITVRGPEQAIRRADAIMRSLIAVAAKGEVVNSEAVHRAAHMYGDDRRREQNVSEVLSQTVLSARGRTIRPKTIGQRDYVNAIEENTIVFGIGPAGTGKTYLAVAKAVRALLSKQVNRIILTRPAVEAGERLGFLPGSLNEKIDPYLRPLYDALHDMLDPESIPKLMGAGTIEVAPLAYMRGRTLNDAFIILDEAQNTSPEQMKMFLTRLGFNSTMVITGDITQVDLPGGHPSGLRMVEKVLKKVDDIEFCHLSAKDVVRHRLVSDIVDAYAQWDSASGKKDRR